jgi:hypothetical protein
MYNWMRPSALRPEASRMVANEALPITRLSIMRPATDTLIGCASSSSLFIAP